MSGVLCSTDTTPRVAPPPLFGQQTHSTALPKVSRQHRKVNPPSRSLKRRTPASGGALLQPSEDFSQCRRLPTNNSPLSPKNRASPRNSHGFYYALPPRLSHQFLSGGKVNVESKKPATGITALSHEVASPIANSQATAIRYVRAAIQSRRVQLVSQSLSTSTLWFLRFKSCISCSKFIITCNLFLHLY